jgi:4-hydroxybenzoate polyprenyltransferase
MKRLLQKVKRISHKGTRIRWRVWATLLRLPNLFTVPGDVLVGWCLSGMRGGVPFLPMLSSLCLYAVGLLWNDCFDAKIDAKERPSRPIPSKQVSRSAVFFVACALAGVGVLLSWTGFPVALLLLGMILFYDLIAKHLAWIGVITMGCCRGLNICLGAASTWPLYETPLSPMLLWAMLFFTAYIVLVSVIAKHEAQPNAKAGYKRFLAPAMTALLIPLFVWFDRGLWWPPVIVVGMFTLFLWPRRKVPVLVAGLIRFLIPLQCVWCLAMYREGAVGIFTAFICCYVGAKLASRRFAGS